MKVLSAIIFIFLFVFGLSAQDLQRDVLSSGGTSVSIGEVIVTYTIGQNFIFNSSSSGEVSVHSGFVHQEKGNEVIVSAKEFDEEFIDLFPVPVSDLLTIKANNMTWDKLQVISAEGRLHKTVYFKSSDQTTDLSDLVPGVYWIRFIKGDQVLVKTITKY